MTSSAEVALACATAARRLVQFQVPVSPISVHCASIASSPLVTRNVSADAGATADRPMTAARTNDDARRTDADPMRHRGAGQPPIGQAIMRGMDVDALLDDWERAWSGRDARAF